MVYNAMVGKGPGDVRDGRVVDAQALVQIGKDRRGR
jgi:hypothetical protein